jgi:VWFA-related protein
VVARLALVIALLGATALARPAAAAEPVRLTIAQAAGASAGTPPDLTVFLDLVDAQEAPPAALDPSAIAASIGAHRATVVRAAPFASTGEGTAYIFLVDVSRSMAEADMTRLRDALRLWLASSNGKDRFALLAFGDEVSTAIDFTADRAAFQRAAASLAPRARTTQLHTAIQRAIELSRRQDATLPARRVAVLLSDGQDEGSGLTADDVAALLRQERLAVYAIGYSRLRGAARARGFDALLRFARNSGGQFHEAVRPEPSGDSGHGLSDVYARMQRAVTRVFAVTLRCDACANDGQSQHLQVQVTSGSRVLSDGIDLRLPPAAVRQPAAAAAGAVETARAPASRRGRNPYGVAVYWTTVLIVVATASVASFFFSRRRRRLTAAAAASSRGGDVASSAAAVGAAPNGIALTLHFRGRRAPAPLTVTLRDHLTVGTDAGCAIVIPDDDEVAEAHCELAWERGHVTLRRIDATLPTLVNGAALAASSRYRLESGDVLLVGRTELRLMFGEEAM